MVSGNRKRQKPAMIPKAFDRRDRTSYRMIDCLISALQPPLEARIELPEIVPQASEISPISRSELSYRLCGPLRYSP
jgi:hypothetical protein